MPHIPGIIDLFQDDKRSCKRKPQVNKEEKNAEESAIGCKEMKQKDKLEERICEFKF